MFQQRLPAFRTDHFQTTLVQQLFPGIAQDLAQAPVRLRPLPIQRQMPQPDGHLLEGRAEPFLAFAQPRLGLADAQRRFDIRCQEVLDSPAS